MKLEKLRFTPNAKGIVSCLALVTCLLSFLFMAMPGTAIAKSEDSPAATEFVVNINDNGEIIPVHTYTIDEMAPLTSDNVVYYSSIDSMPAPNITIAKGVTLSALVADINAKYNANVIISPTTLKSIKLYAIDGWSSSYTYDYLYGSTRYYYPRLVETWDSDNGVAGTGCSDNPVAVEPMFATYSYQDRFLTNLDPNQMIGPADEGSTTFRFCFGQTADDIANNTITNNRFSRLVNRMDIILPDGPDAPVLSADSTANTVGNPIEITFTDNAAWRCAITGVTVNGNALQSGQYTVAEGKITINSSVFGAAGTYTIVIKARGYKDAILVQQLKEIELITPPALNADVTDNNVGHAIEITFIDNAVWRGAINEVIVDGTSISGKYQVSAGKITINACVFDSVKDYVIVVKASDYEDAVVIQNMVNLFQYWPVAPMEPVPGNKTWSIRFSQPVSPTQSLKEHIYVTDAAGKRVDVTCEIATEDQKLIKVIAPKEGYRSGESYILWVKGSLQSAIGKQLKHPVKLQFKIG